MRRQSHRRDLVIWSSSGRYGTRPTRAARLRKTIRTGVLLVLIRLIKMGRAVGPRWPALLAGGTLTAAAVVLRHGMGSMVFFPGVLLLVYAVLSPGKPDTAEMQRRQLRSELAACSTTAQRFDVAAILDRYPDHVTRELRDILAAQATRTTAGGVPLSGGKGNTGRPATGRGSVCGSHLTPPEARRRCARSTLWQPSPH